VSTRAYRRWISKTASYTLAGDDRPQNPALLDGTGDKLAFAFTSPEMNDPHIVIDLGRVCKVEEVLVENRSNVPWEYVPFLTVWVSSDGQAWEKVGYTDDPQAQWRVLVTRRMKTLQPEPSLKRTDWSALLKHAPKARYVKIGLCGRSVLQLRQVRIIGMD
jgi:hypothetical protein